MRYMSKQNVIVGGGIAGLLSAKILAMKGESVILVERGSSLGGLLKSENDNNFIFDMGTHLLRESTDSTTNDYLFGGLDLAHWNKFNNLNVGNYAFGELYQTSQSLNLRGLPEESYQEVIEEIISLEETPVDLTNSKKYLVSKFGEMLYEKFLDDQLIKVFGQGGDELHWLSSQIMGFSRVIGFDEDKSIEMKQQPGLGSRFAFNHFYQGQGSLMNYYPKRDGIGRWVVEMRSELERLGVTILLNTDIKCLDVEKNKVVRAVLKNDEGETAIDVNQLIWSIPSFFLSNLLNLPKVASKKPQLRKVYLLNYEFSEPFLNDNYYVHCYDADMLSFRVTLYSNLRDDKTPICSVEVFSGESLEEKDLEIVLEELREMGIVSPSNPLKRSFILELSSIPVLSNDFIDANEQLSNMCKNSCENLVLVGKAQADVFFMSDVIIDLKTKLSP
jgi:protoporphyrinogen oxidase